MNSKRILSIFLSLSILLGCSAPALAAVKQVPILVTSEAAVFDVTVPSVLPIGVSADGTVTVSSDTSITNYAPSPVAVKGISVLPLNGWAMDPYNTTNYGPTDLGSKRFSMAFNGEGVQADGTCSTDGFTPIWGDDSTAITYTAKVPIQTASISEDMAKVVFTLGWYSGGNSSVSDEQTGYSLSLDKDYLSMYQGTSETVHAVTTSETMVAMLSADDVTWTTTNRAIASVDSGHITANAIGTATIRASYKGLTATCDVRVQKPPVPLQAISFTKNKLTLYKVDAETVLLTYNPDKFTGAADVTFTVDGNAVSVQPSSQPGVTADQGATPVTVSAIKGGASVVTATAVVDGQTITATMAVEVIVPLEAIFVSGPTEVTQGKSISLTTTKYPGDATCGDIAWESSDDTIAKVDQNGNVTGIKAGTVTVIASCGGVKDYHEITVTTPPVEASIDWEYTTNDTTGSITLTKYIGENLDVTVHNRYSVNGKVYNRVVMGESGRVQDPTKDYSYYINQGPFYNSGLRAELTSISFEKDVILPSNASNLFYDCQKATIKGLSNLDTQAVTNMTSMFSYCRALTSEDIRDLAAWDTSKVVNMSGLFSYCSGLTDVDALYDWDTSSTTNMRAMFNGCLSLTQVDGLARWDVSKISDMTWFFGYCKALESIDGLRAWDTSGATIMRTMFQSCSVLTDLTPIAGWDVSSITDMTQMFFECVGLRVVDLSKWDIQYASGLANGMFANCTNLKEIYVKSTTIHTLIQAGNKSLPSTCKIIVGAPA